MIKKGSGQHLEMEELKKNYKCKMLINTVSHVYKCLALETLIKSTPECKFSAFKKNNCKLNCL
ncbi:unnamed protein product [Staurois parvus]|uniref:Uncharacterized protein n=1 Tax=Staurois parvus TaxID=386267 RepID=A0ABN9CHN2_9NEOB|nr:unnamed protein product [Staurois parvus]